MRCLHYSLCVALLIGTVFSSPIQNRTKLTDVHSSAQASDKSPVASGNVYGTDADSTQDSEADNGSSGESGSGDDASGQNEAGNGKDKNQRGYNQGYSYNTGIKPYTTGYTYYQPFGDAAKEQQPQQSEGGEDEEEKALPVKAAGGKKIAGKKGADATPPPMPVDLSNIFDDNGIPNLDNLKLPPPPKGVKVQPLKFEPITTTTARPMAPANFDNFDFNQIMGGSVPGQQAPLQQSSTPQNDNMFDFSPPSNGNFDFAPNNQNTMGQGDPQLMMGGDGLGSGVTNNNNPGNAANGNNFGFGDQQVPSEIVNLNNAFGAGPSGSNGGAPDDLSNMVLGNLDNQQPQQQQQPMMDFGEFGAAAQQNPEQSPFPFGFNF